MAFTVFMHEKPMIRRHSGLVEAVGAVHLRLPGGHGVEGLHIELSLGRGRTQRVIIPFDQLAEIESGIKMARAALDPAWSKEREPNHDDGSKHWVCRD